MASITGKSISSGERRVADRRVTPSSIAETSPSTLLNSLAPRPAKASIAINREDPSRAAELADGGVSLFFDTLAAIGMSDKEAAYTMAVDPAQLSRIKSGQARLPFDAMWRLSDLFWTEFQRRVEAVRGLDAARERDVVAERIGELVSWLVKRELRAVSA